VTAVETRPAGAPTVSRWLVHEHLQRLAESVSTAAGIVDRQHYQQRCNQLTREALADVLLSARELDEVLAPIRLLEGRSEDLHLRLSRLGQVVAAESQERDGDVPAEQEAAVGVDALQADRDDLGLRPSSETFEVGELDAAVQREALAGVVHVHESSSAVGAPGAENTGPLASTVGAPADAHPPSSSAGRGAGGARPRGRWRLPRLRGRP
jgi:heme oxygenase